MFSKRKIEKEVIKDENYGEESEWTTEEGRLVVDVYETEKDLVIQAAIAGIKTEELDISLENDMMIIKGERIDPNTSKNKKYFIRECYFGAFSREIILPREIDTSKIKAEIKDGILTIKMPKIERAKNKRISLGETRTKEENYENENEESEEEDEEEILEEKQAKRKSASKPKKKKEMIYEDEDDMEREEKEYDYADEDEDHSDDDDDEEK
ncbi:MAG: Hsp20/alpha crystallin family protein [Candidatus Paceibacterota bacterium]